MDGNDGLRRMERAVQRVSYLNNRLRRDFRTVVKVFCDIQDDLVRLEEMTGLVARSLDMRAVGSVEAVGNANAGPVAGADAGAPAGRRMRVIETAEESEMSEGIVINASGEDISNEEMGSDHVANEHGGSTNDDDGHHLVVEVQYVGDTDNEESSLPVWEESNEEMREAGENSQRTERSNDSDVTEILTDEEYEVGRNAGYAPSYARAQSANTAVRGSHFDPIQLSEDSSES